MPEATEKSIPLEKFRRWGRKGGKLGGALGGASTSDAKRAAVKVNLATARQKRHENANARQG